MALRIHHSFRKEVKNKKDEEEQMEWLPIGMCIGISVGLCLGVALSNMNNDKGKK